MNPSAPASTPTEAVQLLRLARACEAAWNLESGPLAQTERDRAFHEFHTALSALQNHAQVELRKLGELSPRASRNMTLKTLMALIVPIERLARRSAADEEFLRIQRPHGADAPSSPSRPQGDDELVILADHLRSAFNVGGLIRTGESLGARALWVTGYTPTPNEAPVQKTSMGAELPCERFGSIDEALACARERGLTPVALETTHDAQDISTFRWPEKTLLILGNERFGLEASALQQIPDRVKIPQMGRKNSMNVVVACGIAAHAWANRRLMKRHQIEPIGTLRNDAHYKQSLPRQGAWSPLRSGRVELVTKLQGRGWPSADLLKDLEGFDFLWLIGEFHRSETWHYQVRPPRGDAELRGVWSTRSPHRPNFLALSCVKLEKVEGSAIHISGSDLLDGTPIFDIKPYIKTADGFPEARGGWTDSIEQHRFQLELTTEFTEALLRAEAQGETELREFIWEQLSFSPTDASRKRVRELVGLDEWEMAFRYWRIRFALQRLPEDIDTPKGNRILLLQLSTAVPRDGETSDAEMLRHRHFLKD